MNTEEFLEINKFRNYGYQHSFNNYLWQKKVEEPDYVCKCNNALYINIFEYHHDILSPASEIEIVGETESGDWFKLLAYGLNFNDIPEKYKEIERKLFKAWEAVNE